MKPSCIILAALVTFGYSKFSSADAQASQQETHSISWFFTAKSSVETEFPTRFLADIIGVPGAADRAILRQRDIAAYVSGIVIFYAGRITYSDMNGQVMLPLLEPTDTLMLFVTERITPKISHGNTVESWSVSPRYSREAFSITRVQEGSSFMWNIERIVAEERIPYDAIVICVDPEIIEIPIGKWPTVSGINLMLPNIYVTGAISSSTSALNSIAVSRFFRPTHQWFAHAPERYVMVTT